MQIRDYFLGLGVLTLVAACGSGSIHEGAQARITAKAVGVSSDTHDHADGGDNHAKHSAEYITFRNADGVRIDLQRGQVNLVPVEIKACTTVATLMKQAGAFVLGSAWAHAGEHIDSEPTNYLDALSEDAAYIGALPLETGRYCGVVVAFDPIAPISKHGAADGDLSGHFASLSPCYFFHTAELSDEEYAAGDYDTTHSCVDFQAGHESGTLELDFPEPVSITAEQHHLLIELGAYHETWFDGVAMDDVASVAAEQAKLIANIKSSIYIDAVSFE